VSAEADGATGELLRFSLPGGDAVEPITREQSAPGPCCGTSSRLEIAWRRAEGDREVKGLPVAKGAAPGRGPGAMRLMWMMGGGEIPVPGYRKEDAKDCTGGRCICWGILVY